MNTKRYFEEARNEAKRSSLQTWRMGCVIVKGNRIIGRGFNRFSGKIDGLSKKYGMENLWSLHAECDAIINSTENIRNAVLFIAGIYGDNKRGIYNCRPCKNCMKILLNMDFKAIYYESRDGFEAIYPNKEK